MKVILSVIFVLGCIVLATTLPAPSKKDEVEIIPVDKKYGDQPVIDTGYVGFGGPFSNPFGGLFDSLEGIMTRMREQMDAILRRFPIAKTGTNSSEEFPDFEVAGAFPTFPRFDDVDLSKGNTTSVTKVIDGHKVVINETEYKKEDDFGGAFFKVRIIDVQPESGETTEKDAETIPPITKDRESIENTIENEIPKSSEAAKYANLEAFEDIEPIATNELDGFDGDEWDEIDGKRIPTMAASERPIDLSRDTYVNQILADQGAPTNPDAEVFDEKPRQSQPSRYAPNFR